MSTAVRTGADVLLAEGFARLRGRRVGLLCNHTAVVGPRLSHLADLLHEAPGVELVALFGPEHGVRGEAQDMVGVRDDVDAATGVPVHSLYGHDLASLRPRPEHLEGLDLLVYDIQDVGSRYYTYAATLSLCMESCAAAGVPLMVLDRPNPLGGEVVEGGTVEPGFESFVGLHPLPVRHGMTVGELARYFQGARGIDGELEVVRCEGWRRAMHYEDTGLTWVPPSPNMPAMTTAWVYPGMCLVEGTELSEGRGTTRPFEQCGAPFVDPPRLAARLADRFAHYGVAGVVPRACAFLPGFQKHAGAVCGGVFLHVQDREGLAAYRMGLVFLATVRELWPEAFAWREKPYEFVGDVPAIDLLTGSAAFRGAVIAASALDEVIAAQDAAAAEHARSRTDWLLYD